MPNRQFGRRGLVTAVAGVPVAPAAIRGDMPSSEGAADGPATARFRASDHVLSPAEAALIEAAVARRIPADELDPDAMDAGVGVGAGRPG